MFDEDLKKQFVNIYQFCKPNINKIILMLQKGWTIGENPVKHHYLKNKIFTVA